VCDIRYNGKRDVKADQVRWARRSIKKSADRVGISNPL